MPTQHSGSTLTPSTWEAEARVLLGISGQPELQNEFLDSLSYSVRLCLTKTKNKGKKNFIGQIRLLKLQTLDKMLTKLGPGSSTRL